jgi:hypothetical protein
MRGGFIALHGNLFAPVFEFRKRGAQIQRVTAYPRPVSIGFILPGARYGHPDECGSQGCQYQRQKQKERIRVFVVTASHSKMGSITQVGNRTCQSCRYGANKNIPVGNMSELMCQYTRQFVIVHIVYQSPGNSNSSILRITPGCKSVGLILIFQNSGQTDIRHMKSVRISPVFILNLLLTPSGWHRCLIKWIIFRLS